ncbi:MAG: sugar phosphate isomerase/epimerase family protein [Acidobacteriota bacterium]
MNAIPLACADFSFPLLPHDLVLDLIAGMGIEGVDLSLIMANSHLPVEDLLQDPSGWSKAIRSKMSQRGLAIADVHFHPGMDFQRLGINNPDLPLRRESGELFRRALEFAACCEARHMTVYPGTAWEGEDSDTSKKRSADELAWRVEECASLGIRLAVEAHVGSVIPSSTDARRFLDMVPGLTLTLDYTHFVCQGESEEVCEQLLPFASHFHARGGRLGRLQSSMKENTIDYGRVIKTMKKLEYQGFFELEYVWLDREHLNDVDVLSETILLRDIANRFR